MLRGLLGLAGGAVVAASLEDADAARRPTPTLAPPKCPGRQQPVNGQCVCPADAPNKCGPACCTSVPGGAPGPGHSECCDNACCFGTCYGEELCCPYPREFCSITGECCPEGWTCCPGYGCLPPGLCCTAADCPAQSCQAATCTEEHTCSYAFDCSVEDGCCPAEVCYRSDCSGEGTCQEPVFDCNYDNGGTESCCDEGLTCQPDGTCICVPVCTSCGGPDGCGGTCGCPDGYSCNGNGECYVCGTCSPPFAVCGPGGACRSHCDVEGTTYCVGTRPCDSPACSGNSDCPDGEVCVRAGCCGGVTYCVPICGS